MPIKIPKIIHQTWKSQQIPAYMQSYIDTWLQQNPGWAYRFYDDQACLRFIAEHAPEYLEAYRRLEVPVERANFFRYIVIYKMGGVYADVDTSCEQPLSQWVSDQSVIVGMESNTTEKQARKYHLSQPKTYCQWTFAAVPGCDFLKDVLDTVVHNIANTQLDTLTKTGPAMFTEVVARHVSDPGFQVLGVEAFASGQRHSQKLILNSKMIFVIHHFFGSWKKNPKEVKPNMFYQDSMRIYRQKKRKRFKSLDTWWRNK